MESRNSNDIFQNDIYQQMDNWEREGNEGKTGGANEGGDRAGFYRNKKDPTKRVFFKQDPVLSKNIAEFVAGRCMRDLAAHMEGFNPNAIAQVELAFTSERERPNRNGDNIYIASIVYPNFLELYKDAYLAFNCLDEYAALREDYPELRNRPFPKQRPGILEKDPIVDLMIRAGRYNGLVGILQLCRTVDDPDVHLGNIGVVPGDPKTNAEIPPKTVEVDVHGNMEVIPHPETTPKKDQAKRYTIFVKVDAVKIDHGAAFGDDRLIKRTYNQNNLNRGFLSSLLKYHPSKNGPPKYENKIPSLVLNDPSSLYRLAQIASCRTKTMKGIFQSAMLEVQKKYELQPLLEFAKLIGMRFSKEEKNNLEKKELIDKIVQFMTECFRQFKESALQSYNAQLEKNKSHLKGPNYTNLKGLPERLKKQRKKRKTDHNSSADSSIGGYVHIDSSRKDKLIQRIEELNNKVNSIFSNIDQSNNTDFLEQVSKVNGLLILLSLNIYEPKVNLEETENTLEEIEKEVKKIIEVETNLTKEKIRKVRNQNSNFNCAKELLILMIDQQPSSMAGFSLLKLAEAISITLPSNSIYAEKLLSKYVDLFAARKDRIDKDNQFIKTIDQITVMIMSLNEYNILLQATDRKSSLNKEKLELFQLRLSEIESLGQKLLEDEICAIQKTTNHIRVCNDIVSNINALKNELNKSPEYLEKEVPLLKDARQKIFKASENFLQESTLSASKLLKEDSPKLKSTDLLLGALEETRKAVFAPASVDCKRLEGIATKMEGRPSLGKKIAGICKMVLGALTVLAGIGLIIASVLGAKFTFGVSLFGLKPAYQLIIGGVALFGCGAVVHRSGRQKGLSERTQRIANSSRLFQAKCGPNPVAKKRVEVINDGKQEADEQRSTMNRSAVNNE